MFSFLNRQVHVSRSRWRKKYVFKKPSYTPNWLINRGSVLSYKEKHKVGGTAANFKGQYIGNKKRRNYLAAPTIKPTFILRFKYLLTYILQKIFKVEKRNNCANLKFRPKFIVLSFTIYKLEIILLLLQLGQHWYWGRKINQTHQRLQNSKFDTNLVLA